MYSIKKFADCWAILDLDTGQSRPLTEEEVVKIKTEIPSLNDKKVLALYTDSVDCLDDLP